MNQLEIAWLSGLLEGEGCFMKGTTSKPFLVRISVEMTDEDVIQKISTLTDTKFYETTRKNQPEHYKRCWRICVMGKKAVSILNDIYPYMGERRKRKIDEILKHYSERPQRVKNSDITKDEVQNMYAQGLSYRKIANHFSCSKDTIGRFINK
jgi:hypothetical protein